MVRRSLAVPALCSIVAFALACTAPADEDDVGNDEAAVLDSGAARGAKTIHFAATTTGSPDEICVLPKHLTGADYKSGDTKSEGELCSYSFFGVHPREADAPFKEVAICPKLSSTNPGTDVQELVAGKSREETQKAICALDDRPTKLLAKFKQSLTCSYTPSILGYYHLSRALGGAGDVKPAVVRTMDLAEHRKLVGTALTILGSKPDNSFPKISWLQYRSTEATPAASRSKDAIYTQDLLQIYGGMQENARGEAKYSEINRRAADPNASGLFVQTPQYKRVIDGRPLSQIAGKTLAEAAQPVTVMRDISELLVLDYLMSQQDRFGNIHEIDYVVFPKEGGGTDKVKKSKVDDKEIPMPAGGVVVKKMILKDNDCGGPAKTNVVKNAGLLDQMRHMNAGTYKNLRWLAANFAPGTEAPKFFVGEALFGQKDIDMLRGNLATASQKLHDACVSGKLLLDLDLDDHLAGKAHDPASCEAAEPPVKP
jgi:hypothetical protein